MKVFKFGGASVKDSEAVRNVVRILDLFPEEKIVVVISAMGKTTNAMELIAAAIWEKNFDLFEAQVDLLKTYHSQIISELFLTNSMTIDNEVNSVYDELRDRYATSERNENAFEYDQVVSLGEVLSTKIVATYLVKEGKLCEWADARTFIRTNHYYKEGEVDWKSTEQLVNDRLKNRFDNSDIVVTQGFVGHTSDGFATTLGREGSDFSAGILAYCLDAESVTIWKDVDGMLNADPRIFENTIKLDRISFREAIELSYYGASVIHPKTIKPLQNKSIPLYVKSFIHPENEGTIIQHVSDKDHLIPSFIFKKKQILLSITPRDFSFIVEQNLSDIFNRLSRVNAKMNLMQNSALSFSVLLDEDKTNLSEVLGVFENTYSVQFTEDLELVTIRHYDQATIDFVCKDKKVVLEQKTNDTARFVLSEVD
ncbi:MAG: aspartate kinase [Crocinitomicaceae bacterium]|jgi:aspartate kinase|nr:aspartate kinase [Crocinitomicaceae bacterium]